MGSVAYKLALVSAGLADITFTLTPKERMGHCRRSGFGDRRRRLRQHLGEQFTAVQLPQSAYLGPDRVRTESTRTAPPIARDHMQPAGSQPSR